MDKDSLLVLLVTIVLFGFGLVMIFSSSMVYANDRFHDPYFFIKKQIVFGIVGLGAMIVVSQIPYAFFVKISRILLGISFALVLLTYVPQLGRAAGGARRWLIFGPISFEPSELLKISMVLYLADALSRKRRTIKAFFKGIFPLLIIIGAAGGLVFLQPDLGTAVSIMCVSMAMLFAGGMSLFHLSGLSIVFLPAFYYGMISSPYRRRRLLAFLNPWEDPQGYGFQIIQSLIALGSGGFFGVGLGYGRQKLRYLPEAHTDFIFSIIGEELGCLGTLSLLLLYIGFVLLLTRIAIKTADQRGHYIAVGMLVMIGLESLTNIGVVTGALPTKGLPLPLVSFGGTSVITKMLSLGLVMSVSKWALKQSTVMGRKSDLYI